MPPSSSPDDGTTAGLVGSAGGTSVAARRCRAQSRKRQATAAILAYLSTVDEWLRQDPQRDTRPAAEADAYQGDEHLGRVIWSHPFAAQG